MCSANLNLMSKLLGIFLLVFIIVVRYVSCEKYDIPPALIEPLSPRGFRLSISDNGFSDFGFVCDIQNLENHDYKNLHFFKSPEAAKVVRKENGRWVYHNKVITLKKSDVVSCILRAVKNNKDLYRHSQCYEIGELLDDRSSLQPESWDSCSPSLTTVNGIAQCRGKLLTHYRSFKDFTQDWSPVIQFMEDEADFTLFEEDVRTIDAAIPRTCQPGGLAIRPILLDEYFIKGRKTKEEIKEGIKSMYNTTINLGHRCTSCDEHKCVQSSQGKVFLPPIVSSRLTTEKSFSFRYGTIEIKAALPYGDWVVPEIWLLPKLSRNGMSKIILACAFGNEDLKINNEDRGNKYLYSGLKFGNESVSYGKTISSGSLNDYHTYKMVWEPDKIEFYYDNEVIGQWSSKVHPQFINENDGKIAPYNQEFYIALGLHVGGVGDFTGNVVNRGRGKPWKDLGVSRRKDFYDDHKNWAKTWDREKTNLKILDIKVWSL